MDPMKPMRRWFSPPQSPMPKAQSLTRCLAIILSLAAGPWLHAAAVYKDALIEQVPHVEQKPDFCGEACAEMFLRKLGSKLTQDDVFDRAGLDPAHGRGCYTRELDRALQAIGFATGSVFYQVDAAKPADGLERLWKGLHADLAAGVPSIVCMHSGGGPAATEHFRLILGYSAAKDEIIYHEPAEAGGQYRRMPRQQFIRLWPLKYDAKTWTVVRLRMEPRKIVKDEPAASLTTADFAQHVMSLRAKLPGAGFTIVVQPPFVVIGDEPPQTVRMRAERTVKWAVDKLKQDYFAKDPTEILDVWLFRDKASYERNAKALFNEAPHTPFGYYSAENKALVMNIETGGGTLVHEIVHPYMRANFPACPDWFNEGMGSLYEQASERAGHIVGLTNWRLAGLQKAIKAGIVPEFPEMMGATGLHFYGDDPGTNYAQARYLCYYLQEKGLLIDFYKQFVKNEPQDHHGVATLKKILKKDDLVKFKKEWEKFVMGLRFP